MSDASVNLSGAKQRKRTEENEASPVAIKFESTSMIWKFDASIIDSCIKEFKKESSALKTAITLGQEALNHTNNLKQLATTNLQYNIKRYRNLHECLTSLTVEGKSGKYIKTLKRLKTIAHKLQNEVHEMWRPQRCAIQSSDDPKIICGNTSPQGLFKASARSRTKAELDKARKETIFALEKERVEHELTLALMDAQGEIKNAIKNLYKARCKQKNTGLPKRHSYIPQPFECLQNNSNNALPLDVATSSAELKITRDVTKVEQRAKFGKERTLMTSSAEEESSAIKDDLYSLKQSNKEKQGKKGSHDMSVEVVKNRELHMNNTLEEKSSAKYMTNKGNHLYSTLHPEGINNNYIGPNNPQPNQKQNDTEVKRETEHETSSEEKN